MMKKIVFALFICIALCATVKGEESMTTYDGTTLNKGDILTVGYNSVTASFYTTIKEKITNEYGRDQYLNIKDDLTYSKVKIVDFITPESPVIFPNSNPIVLVKNEQGNKDLYIEINKAIENGEIISVFPESINENAVYLTDDLLMACLIRVNNIPINDNVLLSFIGIKDKELQARCRKDEFELNKAKPQYMELLNKLMDEFDFSATYYVKTKLEMGKYDFSANAYPLVLFQKESIFLPYGDYNFIIEKNRETYQFLPVIPEKAEITNKRRIGTGTHGFIAPLVYGKFYLKLLDKRMELPKNSIINMENKYRHTVVGAELIGLEVYDYPHCEYNFIGSVK